MVNLFVQAEENMIAEKLAKLANGETMPWTEVADLLDRIERTAYWDKSAKSFTEWLKTSAKKLGNKESTLWRYLVVGRYYHDLRDQFSRVKLKYPPLLELPKHVSPEKLELLSKLGRVAPKEFFKKLIYSVLDNEITRDDIREQWRAFRPALKGKTSRGRGTLRPMVNLRNKDEYRSVREAMIINALKASGPIWLGEEKAQMYEVKMHVKVPFGTDRRDNRIFDAVVLYKESQYKDFEVHIIEVMPRFTSIKGNFDQYHGIAEYCDYFWVATHKDSSEPMDRHVLNKKYPGFVGMLQVDASEISVINHAKPCNKNYKKANELLSVLLLKESR